MCFLNFNSSLVQEVLRTGKVIHGIKGWTPLLDIIRFDFSRAFVPEYMHCICLGVIRYFIFLWISPNQKKNPWYLGDKLAIINQRLKNTKPPYEVTRTPQTLLNIKFWKASEFRAFALYYFYVLEDILPEPYFQHFLSLSYGLFCFFACFGTEAFSKLMASL